MKLAKALIFLCSTALAQATQNRTEIDVSFEYQLEVDSIRAVGSTDDVLQNIDSQILGSLQGTLPNGGIMNAEDQPNVKYEGIDSEIFSACFTESEECSLVKSIIRISYEGEKPDNSVEFVTLRLVQQYMTRLSNLNNQVSATYAFPSLVKTLTQFKMNVVNTRMEDTEIEVLEGTFLEVFGAIVFAIEGDTDIVSSKFLYQDLFDLEDRRKLEELEDSEEGVSGDYILQTDLEVRGVCRDCSSEEFGDVVNTVIVDNLLAFKQKLMLNGFDAGTEYFDMVSEVSFAVPELPESLASIEDESIFDDEAPTVKTKNGWFLYFGSVTGFLIICLSGYMINREAEELDKEAFSTSDSSGAEEEESYETPQGEGETIEDGEYTQGEGTYGSEAYSGLDDYQVETVAPTEEEQNSNYEVYVF